MLTAATVAVPLVAAPGAFAGNIIQKCVGSDGTVAYTDKPCGALGATRAPMPGELLQRIARERSRSLATEGSFEGTVRPTAGAGTRRAAASGCARSPVQLTMDLQAAWAMGDVNRIAESYHWVDLDHARAQRIMQRLDALAGEPLLEAEYFDARIGGGALQFADAGNASSGASGILQVAFGDGGVPGYQDFDVRHYRGCYFIRF